MNYNPSPLRQRRPRVKDPKYLVYIRQLLCIFCPWPAEAAHVRYKDKRYDKRETGMGEKPDDKWSLPLCAWHHRLHKTAQHNSNERKWWREKGIDPLEICTQLQAAFPSIEQGEAVLRSIMFGNEDACRRAIQEARGC